MSFSTFENLKNLKYDDKKIYDVDEILVDQGLFMPLIPVFKDVRVVDNGGIKITFVDFDDGTYEKAVCQGGDVYSLEQGICICVFKKLLSYMTGGNGTYLYNRLIKEALKVMKNNQKVAQKAKDESAAEELRQKKAAEKRKKRLAKIAAKKREEQIEIQTEAYLRAMERYNSTSGEEN